jgi:hypothetical protein
VEPPPPPKDARPLHGALIWKIHPPWIHSRCVVESERLRRIHPVVLFLPTRLELRVYGYSKGWEKGAAWKDKKPQGVLDYVCTFHYSQRNRYAFRSRLAPSLSSRHVLLGLLGWLHWFYREVRMSCLISIFAACRVR